MNCNIYQCIVFATAKLLLADRDYNVNFMKIHKIPKSLCGYYYMPHNKTI